ncbi:MAG: HipA domain-containing protein [Planctomycetota bacterium]
MDRKELHLLGLEMAGRVSLSGVQAKLSLGFEGRKTLRVSSTGSRYILKPESGPYPELPANEQLALKLAEAMGVHVATSGLVRLDDGSLALLSKRFDRTPKGNRLAMEDFCQLQDRLPREKYQGSLEGCAKTLHAFASAPLLDAAQLFLQCLASWWIGNGDLHLKNLSLLATKGRHILAPAYDVLCTAAVIPEDSFALTLAGKRSNFKPADWKDFANRCGLPPKVATKAIQKAAASRPKLQELIESAPLSETIRDRIQETIDSRSELIEELANL